MPRSCEKQHQEPSGCREIHHGSLQSRGIGSKAGREAAIPSACIRGCIGPEIIDKAACGGSESRDETIRFPSKRDAMAVCSLPRMMIAGLATVVRKATLPEVLPDFCC